VVASVRKTADEAQSSIEKALEEAGESALEAAE
jgi:hypothetical protein